MRLFIVANLDKPAVRSALPELRAWLDKRVQVTGIDSDSSQDLGKIDAEAVLILGGDGTLLSVARRLDGRQIPLIGVNFGRLGFLASFTPDDFRVQFEQLLNCAALPMDRRLMLETTLLDHTGKSRFRATALNDVVITAGEPFHMIELQISTESDAGVRYYGDGLIITTPSGSTAYNVSAGGPIINADVECFGVTPICPHSLSLRPVVVSANSTIIIGTNRVNEGTTLFCDGQASTKLRPSERILIYRAKQDLLLVENPASRGWQNLAKKLHWALEPRYNDRRSAAE